MAASRLMPMPLSSMETSPASLSKAMTMRNSGSSAISDSSFNDSKRKRSMASEALEMSSRRKISRFE